MKIHNLTPVIYTEDLQETLNFYVQTLGFVCLAHEPDYGWANLQLGAAAMMISKPNNHIPFKRPFFTGSFYFNISDVDAVWEKLKDHTKHCYPIENFEYGMREFAIYDNNGYILQFGQDIT